MKKSAATLLTKQRFWEIIANSNQGETLADELRQLTKDELFGYVYWWDYFHRESYNQALWAVAYTVMGGCSNDGFDYFRYWLVSLGENTYISALANADSLCDAFDDCDYPENEGIAYIPMDVYEEKFNNDYYAEEATYDFGSRERPPLNFEWKEDDEDSIKKIIPNTFAKWWGNNHF